MFCEDEAQYILFEDYLLLVCEKHMDEWIRLMGEANLTFYILTETDGIKTLLPSELDALIRNVNSRLKLWKTKYMKLLDKIEVDKKDG